MTVQERSDPTPRTPAGGAPPQDGGPAAGPRAPQSGPALSVPALSVPALSGAPLPGALRTGAARAGVELRAFFRSRDSLAFTVLLPLLLLVVLGAIFSGEVGDTGVDFRQVFVAGIVSVGIMSVAFNDLVQRVAAERDDGTLRRLAATPMPTGAYFLGKAAWIAVVVALEVVLLIGVGALLYGLALPADAGRWLTLAWVLVLGTAAAALFGLAFTALVPSARSALAITLPVFLGMQFVSGVFFPFSALPGWMQQVAALFPMKWIAQGLRSVFLPDSFQAVEMAGTWEHGRIALVLAAWCVVGLLVALATFRVSGRRRADR